MKSKKLWTAFAVISSYLILCALLIGLNAWVFRSVGAHGWGYPCGFGIALWIGSIVFFCARAKRKPFALFALICNALSSGLLISAYVIGTQTDVSLVSLLFLAAFVAVIYLLFMLLLSLPVHNAVWYVIVAYVVWLSATVCAGIFLYPIIANAWGILPINYGMLLLFFLLIIGFLAFGSVLPVDNKNELLSALVIPSVIATCFIAVIVILVLSGGDGCDCGDACDCGDCSGGQYNSTSYGKKKTQPIQTMQTMSAPQ